MRLLKVKIHNNKPKNIKNMEQEINGKVQKINEEDYEIIKKIEADGYIKAVEWYQESYDCKQDEASEAIKTIKEKYNVTYQGDVTDEIAQKLYSGEGALQVVKWYKETYGLGLKEAKDKVDEVMAKLNIENKGGGASGNGCMITILIAITSTLSIFFLI